PTQVASEAAGDLLRVRYHAKVQVAWPKDKRAPKEMAIVLPRRADEEGLSAFNDAYDGPCGKNEYGRATFWHDFHPGATGCAVKDEDAWKTSAKVSKSSGITRGKYPEYDRVWADGALEVTAIFGESDGGASGDVGAAQYEEFVQSAAAAFAGAESKPLDPS